MPNRGELVLPAARHDASNDSAAWLLVWICAAGWLISAYVAIASQPADAIPVLIAQSTFG